MASPVGDRWRRKGLWFLALALSAAPLMAAPEAALRVAVVPNAPPMTYVDPAGRLTGFTIEIARTVCEEMQARCDFQSTTLAEVVDALHRGDYDFAAVSLLQTPERRAKILFAKPYFRSVSLWLAPPGVAPGTPGLRVAVVGGSAQARYAERRGWTVHTVRTNADLARPLISGAADATLTPMATGLNLRRTAGIAERGLAVTVIQEGELTGEASFGVNPRLPELKERIDTALERIKGDGRYDRINTLFLPFRVN